jgi:hypothetical protein
MNIQLGNLPEGKWRDLTNKELSELKDSLGESLNVSQVQRKFEGSDSKRKKRPRTD